MSTEVLAGDKKSLMSTGHVLLLGIGAGPDFVDLHVPGFEVAHMLIEASDACGVDHQPDDHVLVHASQPSDSDCRPLI
jgi:hypothetical protein